jgi:aminopeptidase-like protein
MLDLYNYFHPEALSVEYCHFSHYLGNHSGYEIIVFLGDMDVMSAITIASYTFTFGSGGIRMLAWRQDENTGNGRFYEVQEAYDLGMLTEDDIKSMYERYNGGRE